MLRGEAVLQSRQYIGELMRMSIRLAHRMIMGAICLDILSLRGNYERSGSEMGHRSNVPKTQKEQMKMSSSSGSNDLGHGRISASVCAT